ncbi:uncharacterized protein [Halyomorpha halys]|uniref:uncharacterized protein isoform X2 n=1 Tax=Halyomorpha halys TaxID=286706 RepID=UPI0034D2A948
MRAKIEVKYSRATFLGVDSMKRTSDCWTEINVNEFTLDINYGFGLASLVLPHLEIDGKNMSAYATVRNNSVHLSYTVSLVEQKCHIKLNELKVEKLGNVEFGASRLEYDNSNLDGFFKLIVTPMLNGILDTNFAKIEIALQALCNVRDFHNPGHAPQLLMSLLI